MNKLDVAYFTMEIALDARMPTFAGGLGVLAGDIMRSCADLGVNAACVTVQWQHGYLRQRLSPDGTQSYEDIDWDPAQFMEKLPQTVTVRIEGRDVTIGAWLYRLRSGDHEVPIYFLDVDLPENRTEDWAIDNYLYGGDRAMRLRQEIVLGIGGVRLLRALGYGDIGTFHMNEGHSAFLTLELLRERGYRDDAVRRSCAFTTHTPVPAGHDVFDYDLAWRVAGDMLPWHIRDLAGRDVLSMTELAMNLSRYTCGVSQIHSEVSRRMFPGRAIDAITNGVHHLFWVCPEMRALFDRHMNGWKDDPSSLERLCRQLPDDALWAAHQGAKQRLMDYINERTDQHFDVNHLTIASARRIVPYKRPELLYTNLGRLEELCAGKVQIIHAGNAHPEDPFSQEVIRRVVERSRTLHGKVKIVYLENYNPDLAKLLTAGADVWLNTPTRLYEASGTSGMKAALNGVLNLSTLDGWWVEGYARDPGAGWRIGPLASALPPEETRLIDAEDVYTQLQFKAIPEYYYPEHVRWIRRMKRAIGLIGYFNTHRCVREYCSKAWMSGS